jgi:hypothetical protein
MTILVLRKFNKFSLTLGVNSPLEKFLYVLYDNKKS